MPIPVKILKALRALGERAGEQWSRSYRPSKREVSRRFLLKLGAMAGAGAIFPSALSWARIREVSLPERSLSFYQTHTGESLRAVYWAEGNYLPQGLEEINYILRDYRTDEIKSIDPGLLDLLFALRTRLQSRQSFHIISGYRSPATNAYLCEQNGGVVKNSFHLLGQAVDIRLPGYSLFQLRQAALHLKRGGVGYYPKSDFVHVDVGRVRSW